jgi:hypothetical protein
MAAGAAPVLHPVRLLRRARQEQGHGDPDTGTPRPPGYISGARPAKASNFDPLLSARVSRGTGARMRPLLVVLGHQVTSHWVLDLKLGMHRFS